MIDPKVLRAAQVETYVRAIRASAGFHYACELACERDRRLGGGGCPHAMAILVGDIDS